MGRVDDLRHGLGGLGAIVAVPRAVAVVQQQDRAGTEARDGAAHDLVDARLGRIPHALRPADDAVAAPLGRPVHEEVAEAVRRAEERASAPRLPPPRSRSRFASSCRGDLVRRRERQQRVVVAVRGDLVPARADLRDQLRMLGRMPPEDEERRLDVSLAQHLEHPGRRLGGRPVVEGQRDHAVGRAVAVDHAAEER